MVSNTSKVNSGKHRPTRYTPAATIVAAWIRALTGVGPSIASGNHTWSGNCADLPTQPRKMPSPATTSSQYGIDGGFAVPTPPCAVTVLRSIRLGATIFRSGLNSSTREPSDSDTVIAGTVPSAVSLVVSLKRT